MSQSLPTWVVDVPFEGREWASRNGARWNKAARAWVWLGARLPAVFEAYGALPFSWEWNQQALLNGGVHLVPPVRLSPFYEPRAHQDEAIVFIQKARASKSPGFLLADEVGVGKTLSAWGFARQEKDIKTILIVTTAPAQAHWRHSILHAGWRPGQAVLIINYDRLDRVFQQPEEGLSSTRRKGKRKRIAKEGTAPAFDLVIFDESHKGKNPESARGKMMQKLADKAAFCIWASATAGQTPIDLAYLGKLLAKATGKRVPMKSVEDFAAWCIAQGISISKGAYGKLEWQRNAEDLAQIRQWLFEGTVKLGLRRRPEEIAGWRALEREMMPMDLPPASRASYAKLWADFVATEMARHAPGARKPTPAERAERETNRMRLRQQSSWLRIEPTVALALDLLENGKSVTISVAFLATQEEMKRQFEAAKIEVAIINGKQATPEKEANRLDFQYGRKKVVIYTVEEAISLHQGEYLKDDAPRIQLIHDIRWSAIQMAQIEGRPHRDGSFAPSFWLAASDTVEMDIAQVMVARVADMKAMHGDDVGDLKAIEDILAKHVQASARAR